ncbi:MAG: hypothetical protein Kow00127_02600 [Bacteroidales bacterium]
MKKFTILGSVMAVMMSLTLYAQMPEAITVTPENPTAFDEITLTLDATKSCPAEALYGAGTVMMHSGITIDGAAWQNVVAFDQLGANGQAPVLVPDMGPLPAAISMTPRYATATDTITITLDARLSCPEGALFDADSVMMHSGVTIDGNAWQNVIEFNQLGANGQAPKLTYNGDTTWSITLVPADFYGVTSGEVTAINCVFNAGDWSLGEGKDFDEDGNCKDFLIPLASEYTHTWSITFTPADFYGVEQGTNVSAIDCVFNAGDWSLGEGKDFDNDGNCADFKVPLAVSAVNDRYEVLFKMYPNPAGDQLFVEGLNGASKVEVYNVIGEKVLSVNDISNNKVELNTSNLVNGVYMVTVYRNGNVETAKFLKK